ncbi:hypothetical protein BMS3Bbin09_00190 [bacterium BMS3Bbin09]|nr:hypothetical protein BMS3Bbin09_00190 [bacterium BMS3Bbin09]
MALKGKSSLNKTLFKGPVRVLGPYSKHTPGQQGISPI